MTINIVSIDDIFRAIPNVQVKPNGELHSPCPFCANDGVSFEGEDRFFWLDQASMFYCRHCGLHSIEDTCDRLFSYTYILDPNFVETSVELAATKKKNELYLTDDNYVDSLHANVQRQYWYGFGWTDATIDHFKLGYGGLYPFSKKAHRHVIPFKPHSLDSVADGYALEGRLSHNIKGEERNIKTQGVGNEYFGAWLEGESDVAVICEGLKDGITAWQLGYRHIYCLLGNTTDMNVICAVVNDHKYEQIIVFTDKDEAGLRYFKQIEKRIVDKLWTLIWPPNAKASYDLTNLFEEYGDDTTLYIAQNIYSVDSVVRGFISDVRLYDPDYVAPTPAVAVPRDEIRKELPLVLNDFVTNYKVKRRNAGRGVVKVLGGDPGIGKSYALVQLAENLARKALEDFKIEKQALLTVIADYEAQIAHNADLTFDEKLDLQSRADHFKTRYDNLSCATVLYAGPFINGWDDILEQGADLNLWFNYEARNENNCGNINAVSQLASKGYMPSAFCHMACPLKAACEQQGYLRQAKLRRAKPITYVRHQQLRTSMIDEYQYIIIDENCLSVFDDPLVVSAQELAPTHDFWDSHINEDQAHLIDDLIEALRGALRQCDEDRIYSGRQVMSRIDDALLGKLQTVLNNIDPDAVASYHPTTVMGNFDFTAVPIRCLPTIYNVLLDELPLYLSDQQNYNSGLHVNAGKLEIYSLDKHHISHSRPIIVSDGTPFPELYGLLFDREIEIYAPMVYNPQTQTTVLYGSDFTRTSIKQQLGFGLQDFHRWLEDNNMIVDDIFGQEFDLTQLPIDDNIYDSSMLKRIIALLKSYAEMHNSLLFITYKNVRALIEHRMNKLYPELSAKIHYGHYWSLRGTNKYKDVEAVFIVGCPRVPYEMLHRKIQAWGKLADIRWIPPNVDYAIAPYHGVGRYEANTYPTFTETFASRFVDMVEVGECRQNVARIRGHTSDIPKNVYAAVGRPALTWVTHLDRVGRLANTLDNQRYRNAYQFMRLQYQSDGTFPTYKGVASEYHLSYTKIKEIRSKITGEHSK